MLGAGLIFSAFVRKFVSTLTNRRAIILTLETSQIFFFFFKESSINILQDLSTDN